MTVQEHSPDILLEKIQNKKIVYILINGTARIISMVTLNVLSKEAMDIV